MRILLAGAGRSGTSIALHLQAAGHSVTVLDLDPTRARVAFEKNGLVVLVGDATEPSLLKDAELHRAEVVIGMLPRDADNLAVAVMAKSHGVKRVLVRMRDASYRTAYERVGVTRILSETEVVVGALITAVEHDAIRHAMLLGAGGSVAFELHIPDNSAVAGRLVSDIAAAPDFPSCVFAGIYDAEGIVHAPRGSSRIEGGRNILLVARRADLANVATFFLREAPSEPA